MRSCLIVDAQHGTRSVVHGFLAQRQFDITAVSSVDEALDVCRKAMPDVIVYDESADREGGGAAFIRRLRRSGRGVAPVVLYCADKRDPETLSGLILDGASECLMKPFDDDLLEFKLRQSGIDTAEDADCEDVGAGWHGACVMSG